MSKSINKKKNTFWSWKPWDWGIVERACHVKSEIDMLCRGEKFAEGGVVPAENGDRVGLARLDLPGEKRIKKGLKTEEDRAQAIRYKIGEFFDSLNKEEGATVSSVKCEWIEHLRYGEHDKYILTDIDVDVKLKGKP